MGGPMAVIAYKCPDREVNVVDIDVIRIEKWNSSNLDYLPVFEPGLKEIIENVEEKIFIFQIILPRIFLKQI